MSSDHMTNHTNTKTSGQVRDPVYYELELRTEKETPNGLDVAKIQDDQSNETPDIKVSNIIGKCLRPNIDQKGL